MRRPLELLLPRRRQWSWWAILASVGVHVLLLSVRATDWFGSAEAPPNVMYIPIPSAITQIDMAYREVAKPSRPRPRPLDLPEVEVPVAPNAPEPVAEITAVQPGALPRALVDSAAGLPSPEGTGRQSIPRLRPALGEGKLWVRPLPLPPRELAQRLTRSHYELIDSAVSEIVQAYIDSIIRTPVPFDSRPPSWTTQIGGKTFGIDSKNIYLGGLKIPTAILALLPIPAASNIDLRSAHRMADIQADLQYAAQRAQTMEEFKRAIKDVREKRERELEFQRNQRRTAADSTKKP